MRVGGAAHGRRIALVASALGLTTVTVTGAAGPPPAPVPVETVLAAAADAVPAAPVPARQVAMPKVAQKPAAAPTPTVTTTPIVTGAPIPFDTLPEGEPPLTVPYGIGTRVYFNGRLTDLTDRFTAAFPGTTPRPDQRQFATVVGADGAAWTQIVGSGADAVHVIGRVTPAGGYLPFHTSAGRVSPFAVTTHGVVAMPESGQAYATDGAYLGAFTGSPNIDCGSCAAGAAGSRVLLDQWSSTGPGSTHQATWLWYPPAAIQKVDDRLRAVGRLGEGWVGLELERGCWRIAPAAAPTRLGARFCSLTTPLVSEDGRRAVVVQAGRLRVLDPVTGAPLGVAAMPALTGWAVPGPAGGPARYLVPAAWEDDDSYVVTARVDDALALLRCSAATGACERTVRVQARPGIDRIVSERTLADVRATAG
jgi:hypothetical protein